MTYAHAVLYGVLGAALSAIVFFGVFAVYAQEGVIVDQPLNVGTTTPTSIVSAADLQLYFECSKLQRRFDGIDEMLRRIDNKI